MDETARGDKLTMRCRGAGHDRVEATMFGLGPAEVLIVVAIVAVIFGVGRLPEIGGAMGKTIREFKSNMNDEPARQPVATPAAEVAPLPKGPEGREGAVRREEV